MDKKQAISDRLAKNLPTKHKKTNQDYIDKKDIKDDYEFSRETLKDLIKVGTYSMDSLARRWKWSYGKAKRFLKQLEKKGKIEMQKTSVSTTITLAHFVENGKQMENKRKTNGQQTENKRSPINIDKNDQIEKIDNTILHSAAKAPQLINIFGEEFKSYTDTEYHASFGKDRKILKSLEDHYGRDDVIAGIKYFFQVYIRKDRYARKNPNVGMLQNVWNGMVASATEESRRQRDIEDWVNE